MSVQAMCIRAFVPSVFLLCSCVSHCLYIRINEYQLNFRRYFVPSFVGRLLLTARIHILFGLLSGGSLTRFGRNVQMAD